MAQCPRRRHHTFLLIISALTSLALIWHHVEYFQIASKPNLQSQVSDVSFDSMHNAMEDAKLRSYISSEKHKVKGVIIYLAHTPRLKLLLRALNQLHRQFNTVFRYPVVIFHEADLLPMIETVRRAADLLPGSSLSYIFFQQVSMSVPDWVVRKFGQPPLMSCDRRSIGYRSMCRFHAKLVYEQPVLRHFEYMWRLDDDSAINSMIEFDVFEHLKDNGYSYGFILSAIDDCAHNIYNVTMDYVRARGIAPTFMDAMQPNEIFMNNFEISSTKFWLSKRYRDYIEHIDSLGGIYMHRWGDAPIKTLALRMHVPLREIHRFKTIDYHHHGNKDLFTKFLE